ncbi:hypothetical protein N136_01549 [Leifsonia aquatica ATCC 14665]|uniref:Uncharacterized protein n=1 Tax=Leifsonia aquatica ATCC 14665 TaxID=1358026 RepID=U2RU77_LEIAQ|nr:hypothetical protein N136_01549 [Leifsonia aquatica ATCC 14665]
MDPTWAAPSLDGRPCDRVSPAARRWRGRLRVLRVRLRFLLASRTVRPLRLRICEPTVRWFTGTRPGIGGAR